MHAPTGPRRGGRGRLAGVVAALALLLLASGLAAIAPTAAAAPATVVTALTVEHRETPLGIDAAQPRFGWQTDSTVRGQRQTAYRVVVATNPGRARSGHADVWDSGKVASADQVAIRYAGPALEPSTRYWWTVQVWDKDGRRLRTPEPTWFETALLSSDGVAGWDGARWIAMAGKQPNTPGAPMLRREVPLEGEVASARLYISALGVYDAYVNGKRVGVPHGKGETVELLTPGWTNYDKTTNYMTYDVTELVGDGEAVTLGAVLGNGWYNGRISAGAGAIGRDSAYYKRAGNPLGLKAKLLLTYADGSTQSVVTEPGAGWRATDDGPYVADEIYDGQTYDARKEIDGWSENGFDDTAWAGVVEHPFTTDFPQSKLVAYPGETARVVPEWQRDPQSITVHTGVTGQEGSANGRGHIVVDESRSTDDPEQAAGHKVTLSTGEAAIYDLGQNMVGVPSYTVSGPAGAELQVRFGEMLNDDSEGADGPEGSVYYANLRSAKATSTYTLAGEGSETHQDSLSFYGFRYVEVKVTSPGTTVTVEDLTGKVATSAIRDTGSIETDDERVNKLFANTRWGQRGNYLWVPTDCPQRDERQGWTGDTQVFANTGLYNGDAGPFLSHFMDTLIDSQQVYGGTSSTYTATAPGGAFAIPDAVGTSGWSDVGVVLPWTVWQMTGDSTIIDDSWESMTSYVEGIHAKTGATWAGPGAIFGDWLAFQRTANQFMSDAYYAYSVQLLTDMAEATGRTAAAQKYAGWLANIRAAFMTKYVHEDPVTGQVRVRSSINSGIGFDPNGLEPEDDTQAALLWVLKLGFYEDEQQRQQLVDLLAANIENTEEYRASHPGTTRAGHEPNTLSVGFLGVNVIAPVLSEVGRSDLAYTLLHQDALPSWMYSVKNGATTIWERWNSWSEEDGFGPVDMNSFNHYAYGAIVEWMYEDMAGIAKDPANPGFEHFFLQPTVDPTGKVTRVEGSYDSPYGVIESSWQVRGRTLSYRAVVPANSTATLRIPAGSADAVREGRGVLASADGVRFVGFADGVATFELASGSYEITSTMP